MSVSVIVTVIVSVSVSVSVKVSVKVSVDAARIRSRLSYMCRSYRRVLHLHYKSISLTTKRHPTEDHHRALDIKLL